MFITLEGGEGVGKTTLLNGISQWLQTAAYPHIVTREPGGTPLADRIRSLFLNPDTNETMHKETELCLVSAARSQHVQEKILPALRNGQWVLCDRFADSSRVYQQILGALDDATVEAIVRLTTCSLEPDLTIIIDCQPEIAMQRVSGRNSEGNRYDNAAIGLHRKIREAFLTIHQRFPDRTVVVDGSQSSEIALKAAITAIKARIDHD